MITNIYHYIGDFFCVMQAISQVCLENRVNEILVVPSTKYEVIIHVIKLAGIVSGNTVSRNGSLQPDRWCHCRRPYVIRRMEQRCVFPCELKCV